MRPGSPGDIQAGQTEKTEAEYYCANLSVTTKVDDYGTVINSCSLLLELEVDRDTVLDWTIQTQTGDSSVNQSVRLQ